MKIEIDTVKAILQRRDFDSRAIKVILDDIDREIKLAQEEKELNEPPIKKQYVVLLNDPQGKFKAEELSGWVVQIPEEESVYGLLDKVYKTACDFNLSARGRRFPLRRVSELMEFCTPKIAKEHKLWIKTKEPIAVISTNNAIE